VGYNQEPKSVSVVIDEACDAPAVRETVGPAVAPASSITNDLWRLLLHQLPGERPHLLHDEPALVKPMR
jgi:hypothetical protein